MWCGCWRACGISFVRCCLDRHLDGAAFEQLWRSVDRNTHMRAHRKSHAQRDCWCACDSSFGCCCLDCRLSGAAFGQPQALHRTVAVTSAVAAPPLGSFGVLSIASLTLRFGSAAVLTRGAGAGVRAASALGAAAMTAALVCNISYGRCRRGRHLGGAAFEQLRRLSVAACKHRINSAVTTRSVTAGVLAASALIADTLITTLVELPGNFWRSLSRSPVTAGINSERCHLGGHFSGTALGRLLTLVCSAALDCGPRVLSSLLSAAAD